MAEVIDVNVRLAQQWLDTYATRTPRTVDAKVMQYVNVMRAGSWRHFSGSYIVFRDGVLADGWARLTAVTLAAVTCSFLVDGRIPEPPPPTGGLLLRNAAGRIICQFCTGDYGRGLQRREIHLSKDGVDYSVDFVICNACLKKYRIPNSQAEWFDSPAARREVRHKTAEETADAERNVPRFQPMGELVDCTRCTGKMRVFETIHNKKYALDVNQLRTEEVMVDHRWVYVPQTRRVKWDPYLREGALCFFPHHVVCGASKTPPGKPVTRAIWASNGGQRPVNTDFDDGLFDVWDRSKDPGPDRFEPHTLGTGGMAPYTPKDRRPKRVGEDDPLF